MGRFSKSGKFKLGVTCLDWLAKYAKYKVGRRPASRGEEGRAGSGNGSGWSGRRQGEGGALGGGGVDTHCWDQGCQYPQAEDLSLRSRAEPIPVCRVPLYYITAWNTRTPPEAPTPPLPAPHTSHICSQLPPVPN
jgi:hypothetical protein